jgi:agmatine deiminase
MADPSTPKRDGLFMPAEFGPHQACLMEWPTTTRKEFWASQFEQAKADYAEVARAIAAFEPVVMVCEPGASAEVHDRCGAGIEPLEIPIDDSWMRDNGPIFVVDGRGGVALVHFRFNSWGEKYLPYDKDAEVPRHIASHLGMRRYEAPFVLEGGSIFVDGEGTLITTEQCLLNPNRNPTMTREQIEDGLRDYLGVKEIIWLPKGIAPTSTDGHVDGIAQYVRPGTIILLNPADRDDPNVPNAAENLDLLATVTDAAGRKLEVLEFPVISYPEIAGERVHIPYLNFYLANGGVVMPIARSSEDEEAIERVGRVFPGREVVPIPGAVISYGGGGPHCLTQQVPAGEALTAIAD